MQTSRFQLGLIATLAIGLGFSLASSDAVGYPAAGVVSLGSNPVFSQGGVISDVSSTTNDVLTAPAGQAMLVTDLGLGLAGYTRSCDAEMSVTLSNSAGATLAEYVVVRPDYGNNYGSHSGMIATVGLNSGIPLAPGETLRVTTNLLTQDCSSGTYQLRYTLSGYYVQP